MGSSKTSQVLSLEFAISVDSVDEFECGAEKIVKHVRPKWNTKHLKFKVFTDGLTNKLMGCYLEGGDPDDVVVVRVNGQGSNGLIDRDAELANFLTLSAQGCAPQLYATFRNGIAYGFFPGTPLDENSVRQPEIQRLIAQELARLHHVHKGETIDGSISALYKKKLQSYLDAYPDSMEDPVTQKRFLEKIPSKAELVKEFTATVKEMEALQMNVVFCHNDLLLKNIIYDDKNDAIHFIDYEYAFHNYDAYDIGNHFTEFAGTKDIDYSLYPSKQEQWPFLKHYLISMAKFKGGSEDSVLEKDIEHFYIQVNKCACAAHLFWGIWAVIQAARSVLDFDYIEFADARLTEYFKQKEECEGLKEQRARWLPDKPDFDKCLYGMAGQFHRTVGYFRQILDLT